MQVFAQTVTNDIAIDTLSLNYILKIINAKSQRLFINFCSFTGMYIVKKR